MNSLLNNNGWECIQVIDSHAHVNEKVLPLLLKRMKELGIERTIVIAGGVISPYQLSHQIIYGGTANIKVDNRFVIHTSRTNPKLVPYYFVNPYEPVTDQVIEDIRQCKGIKFAPGVHGLPYDDPRIMAYMEIAEQYGLSIYSHCLMNEGNSVEAFVELAQKYRQNKFILGHAGRGNFDLIAAELVYPHENIWFETSGGFDYVIRDAINRLGAGRVLFGSEFPIQHQKVELVKLSELLKPGELELVLRKNSLQFVS